MITKTPLEAGPEPFGSEVLAGAGSTVGTLRVQVSRIAPHFRVALLTGERGAGKNAVAREMHRLSPAPHRSFTEVHAADFAQPPESSPSRGTVYVRGIESLSSAQQTAMLRGLKSLHRETRVIVASDLDLRGLVASGKLQREMYQYIAMVEIRVAPLRDRMPDFDVLADRMLRRSGGKGFSPAALERLREHTWPGNFGELWQYCQAASRQGGVVEREHLPGFAAHAATGSAVLRLDVVIERHVIEVLQKCSGNKLRAAELLGISRSTLYRMLETA